MQIRNRYFVCDTGDGVFVVAVRVNAQGGVMRDYVEGGLCRVLDELSMRVSNPTTSGMAYYLSCRRDGGRYFTNTVDTTIDSKNNNGRYSYDFNWFDDRSKRRNLFNF